jgi:hypothetical protein
MPSINAVKTWQIVSDQGDIVATVEFNPTRPHNRGAFSITQHDPERHLKMEEVTTFKQAMEMAESESRRFYKENPDFRQSEDAEEPTPPANPE